MWFGAQRALLLQLAHPAVAAGVDHHSGFREQPHRRLWSTADTMLLMVWGRAHEASSARALVHGVHDRIHGELPDDTPPGHAGDPYSAHDPLLLRWVWSTLVDTTDVVHARFVGPLDPDRRDALYRDWLRFATFFGVPGELLPSDRRAFEQAYHEELEGLAVSPTARQVARSILDPPIWWAPRQVKAVGRTIAVTLLPPEVREGYGFPWTTADQAAADRLQVRLRRAYRCLPAARRELPYVYLAARRAVTALTRAP